MKNQWCLVLGGGGSKGAYQIGACRALKELGYRYEAVIGTSAGAMNGAFLIQKELDKAWHLWESMTLDKVLRIPEALLENGRLKIGPGNFRAFRQYQKEILNQKGLDITPLRQMINQFLDEKKIRKSGIDFGLNSYDVSSFRPVEVFLENIPPGELADYLVASSSLPGFAGSFIKGRRMVDGGIYDNIPFAMARKRGYRNIIVLDCSGMGINRTPEGPGTQIIYLKNSRDLGHILDFDPEKNRRYLNMGYSDAMRLLGGFEGEKYTLRWNNRQAGRLESILNSKPLNEFVSRLLPEKHQKPASEKLSEILPVNYRQLKNRILAYSECAAFCLNLPYEKIYPMDEWIREIYRRMMEVSQAETASRSLEALIERAGKAGVSGWLQQEERCRIFSGVIFQQDSIPALKLIRNLIPEAAAAAVFYQILTRYFRD